MKTRETVLPKDLQVGDCVRPQFGIMNAFIDCIVMFIDKDFIYLGRPYMYILKIENFQPRCSYEYYPIEINSEYHKFTLLSRND